MKKVLSTFVLAFLIGFTIIHMIPSKASAESSASDLPVHNINTGLDYATIQEAINTNMTMDGHTIQVDSGTCYEYVVIDKSVSLVGENKFNTIIDGKTTGTVIRVTADNVSIAGFTIQNSGLAGFSGIHLDHSRGSNISRNILVNNSYGIYSYSSGDNVFSGNYISDNDIGIRLSDSFNNTLTNNDVSNSYYGIYVSGSSNNILTDNNVFSNSYYGIYLHYSSDNILRDNDASNNQYIGIYLYFSGDNVLLGNYISDNNIGIHPSNSSNNMIFHNTFLNNSSPLSTVNSVNSLDNGVEGNYWNDYIGVDDNQDAVGDTPYIIDEDNIDNYPLMGMFSVFKVPWEKEMYNVHTICNSTISQFQFDYTAKIINFNVTGLGETVGFCRVMIPKALINEPYLILVDGEESNATVLPISNSTYGFLYFTYILSTREVTIVSKHYYELLQKYDTLLESYNSLNSTYNELMAFYCELESKHNVTTNELTNIRNQMYLFRAAITMEAVVAVILLLVCIKYFQMFNQQKKAIQAYSPLGVARALFKADVEGRKMKIRKFEEKYGVRIRPHNTLEDVIRRLKEKVKH